MVDYLVIWDNLILQATRTSFYRLPKFLATSEAKFAVVFGPKIWEGLSRVWEFRFYEVRAYYKRHFLILFERFSYLFFTSVPYRCQMFQILSYFFISLPGCDSNSAGWLNELITWYLLLCNLLRGQSHCHQAKYIGVYFRLSGAQLNLKPTTFTLLDTPHPVTWITS